MKRWIQLGCLLAVAGTCILIGLQQHTEENIPTEEAVSTEIVQATEAESVEEPIVMKLVAAEPPVEPEVILEAEPVEEAVEEAESTEETQPDEEYANFAISDVTHYVNVRKGPSTDEKIVGKMYNGSVAQILEISEDEEPWLKIISGSVEGYIKAEYFIYGEAAVEVMDAYVTQYASITANRLNVRKEASADSNRIGYLEKGEKAKLLIDDGEWLKVEYSEGKEGYISAEYAVVEEEYKTAISLEEERAQRQQEEELKRRQKQQQESIAEDTQNAAAVTETPASGIVISGDHAELRQQILDFAMQYLGNVYVHGGNSLETGTDCSGFTSLIYKEFGYSLSRTPGGQLSSAGTLIDVSQIQIGDVVCYGKKGGKCTHVALYAGDDKIIHSSTPRSGVIIGNLYYDNILGVKNIID